MLNHVDATLQITVVHKCIVVGETLAQINTPKMYTMQALVGAYPALSPS